LPVHVTYGYALRRIMRRHGYSIRRLALEARVDRAGLRRLRAGSTLPSWRVACRIAEALATPLHEFVMRKHHRKNTGLGADGSIESEGGDDEA